MLDPRLRLGLKQRVIVTEMLEMGWLYTSLVRYTQTVEGERRRRRTRFLFEKKRNRLASQHEH